MFRDAEAIWVIRQMDTLVVDKPGTRQNLYIAVVLNTMGIPIAAGHLNPWYGIMLSPLIAVTAMSFSSVSAIPNGLRLSKDQV